MLYWHNYWIICWIVIVNVEFTLGLIIEYVGIISIDWVNWLWLLLIFVGLWINLGSIQYRGGAAEFFFTFEFKYIIIYIKLVRCTEWKLELHVRTHQVRLAARKITLGDSQEEAPIPLVPSTDAAFSSAISQRRSGVPSQRNQFSRKYEAQWKDDLSM